MHLHLGNENLLDLLIENGIDPNAKQFTKGKTPLFIAAESGNPPSVQNRTFCLFET